MQIPTGHPPGTSGISSQAPRHGSQRARMRNVHQIPGACRAIIRTKWRTIQGTHGTADAVAPRAASTSRTVSVWRQPGGRGWPNTGVPTTNSSNVIGTSIPGRRVPNGQPAENNKVNPPLRIKPTSPSLRRGHSSAGAGSLGVGILRSSNILCSGRSNDILP